eukprot:COSAG05_NODE_19590_length_290_cov_1.015707_1_plen_60_part_00
MDRLHPAMLIVALSWWMSAVDSTGQEAATTTQATRAQIRQEGGVPEQGETEGTDTAGPV